MTQSRADEIRGAIAAGTSQAQIAAALGISTQRVGQILSPEKVAAREAVKLAIRAGRLIRPEACGRCGGPGPQAHHHDYAKPLEVEWLCASCHGIAHAGHTMETFGVTVDSSEAALWREAAVAAGLCLDEFIRDAVTRFLLVSAGPSTSSVAGSVMGKLGKGESKRRDVDYVEMGRRGSTAGWASLTPEERAARIARMKEARWGKPAAAPPARAPRARRTK